MPDSSELTVGVTHGQPGGVCVLEPVGRLDPETVAILHDAIEEGYRTGARRFVFDLSGLTYIGSLGLREFVKLASRVKGEGCVCLSDLRPTVQTVFDVTRLALLVRIFQTRAEAVAAASPT